VNFQVTMLEQWYGIDSCLVYRGVRTRSHALPFLFDVMQNHSAVFLNGTRLLCAFNASWRVYSKKRLWTNCL